MAINPQTGQEEDDFWTVQPVDRAAMEASGTHPFASFGDNPAGAINRLNPTGDPGLRFAQVGTTGGALMRADGGSYETVGEGRSITPEQAAAQIAQARAEGIPEGYIQQYLKDNPLDTNRLSESWKNVNANTSDNGSGAGKFSFAGSGGQSGGPQSIQPFSFDSSKLGQTEGFKFRFDKAMQAIERSGAARGTLLTPQTTNALQEEASGLASQELDAEFARQFDTHTWNEGSRFDSQRTNRMDDFGIMDTDRRFNRGVLESDRMFDRGVLTDDRNFAYGQQRDTVSDHWRGIDYGYNAARR